MQVFVPYINPYETARVLDAKRLRKQVIECHQILSVLNGTSKAWSRHPIMQMYEDYVPWLRAYTEVLERYIRGDVAGAITLASKISDSSVPKFFTDEYIINMRKRLYTKNKQHYARFAEYGESYVNMYYVDGVWKYYKQDDNSQMSLW